MPRPVRRDGQTDFRGGLNLAADDAALAPNEVRRADDAVLDEFGAIKKRAGTQHISDSQFSYALGLEAGHQILLESGSAILTEGGSAGTAATVVGGYAWKKDNGTQQLLVVANGQLYTGAYGIPMTFTGQTGSMDPDKAVAFAAFRDASSEVVYLADGASATSLNKWNGTSLTINLANTPAFVNTLAVYNQRLFGCTGLDQKIYWSAINNGDSLGYAPSGGGEAIIRTFSDQNITGLAAFGSSLLIFHRSGISRFTGLTQDDIAIAAGAQGLSSDVGAVSGRSIVTTPQGIYFLSDRGFFLATETGVQAISLKLDPLIRRLDLTSTEIIGVHRRALKEVWWFVPGQGVFRFNYALGAWTGPCQGGYLTPATASFWEAEDDEGQPIVLAGDAGGYVKQCDVPGIYRDNAPSSGVGGTSYTLAVRCRRFFHGDMLGMKAYKWIYLQSWLKASSLASVTWRTPTANGVYTFPNTSGTLGEWGTGTWGTGQWGAGAQKPVRVPVNGYGEYVDIYLTDGGDAQSVWSRVEVEGFDYGRRY